VAGYLYGFSAHDVTRDFFFNAVDRFGITRWVFLAAVIGAIIFLIMSIVRRVKIWNRGKAEPFPPFSFGRLRFFLYELFCQKRVLREKSGIAHAFIFYGMIGSILLTGLAAVQEYITLPFFDLRFIAGDIYLDFALLDDMFSIVVLTGLSMALIRRFVFKPASLSTTRSDVGMFALIGSFILTGLISGALRVAISDLPGFEVRAPLTYLIARVFTFGSEPGLEPVQFVFWWSHALTGLALIALAASSRLGHITLTALNIYAAPEGVRKRSVKYILPMSGAQGAGKVTDLSSKLLMDTDACTGCGRCEEQCPAHLAEKPLSPKKVINDLSCCLDENIRAVNPGSGVIGDYVKDEAAWSCANCAACMEACPSHIDHLRTITEIRKGLLLHEKVPAGYAQSLSNIREKGDPAGAEQNYRSEWYADLPEIYTLEQKREVDCLYFAGCAVSDNSVREAARDTLTLLVEGGVTVGVLGSEECCCGDAALRIGDESLFRSLARKNIESFHRYGVKRIVTSCPHGYNILNKEYRTIAREIGMPVSYKVTHSTEMLSLLMKKEMLKTGEVKREQVTFHDPCFLGRYNNEYRAPRELIEGAGGVIIELPRSKQESLCCGGNLHLNGNEADKLAAFRARDLYSNGTLTTVTACPHCATMLRKGLTSIGVNTVRIVDIASYLAGK
jgi:Fe-S oxidoreductase